MWICSVLLKSFFKKIKNVIIHQKNYKIITENVFSQPEICRVINIKCFSEIFRTLSNLWCREFFEIIYWVITVKSRLDVWWDPESVSAFTIRRFRLVCKHVIYTTIVNFHLSIVYRRKIKNRKKECVCINHRITHLLYGGMSIT